VPVGTRAVILNKVTGRNDDISAPVVIAVMIEGRFQGRISYCATQVACGVGKQVRIRQVQDPQRLRCVFDEL
jgi:hypothetical protein